MHCWRSIFTGGLVVIFVVTYSIFIFFWSRDACPVGTFPCYNNSMCVPQRSVCNFHWDCSQGEDEDPVLCTELSGSLNMIRRTLNKSSHEKLNYQVLYPLCDLGEYPSNCKCILQFRIVCKDAGLVEVPQHVSINVTHLILANNSIHTLSRTALSKYNLKVLHLEGNQLLNLPPKVFYEQNKMERLLLMHNNLTVIKNGTFDGLYELLWLILYHNQLTVLEMDGFKDLRSLEWIDLSHNKLRLEKETFPPLPKLLEVFLSYNNISRIGKYTFSQLANVELISLKDNNISFIHRDAFQNLKNLLELNLYGNRLTQLSSQLFNPLPLLGSLYLGHNPLHYLPSNLFSKLENLGLLNLEDIEIENIDLKIFSNLKKLNSVYFKKYFYCTFAPTVPRCRPLSDGVSSVNQLLVKPILRYATWATCLITCLGNVLVIWGRLTFRDENKVLSLVIRNLAGSDLLMGVYLLIIGYQDLKFRDIYNKEAHEWMSSWLCTLTGILAITSSEVSVLLLVFMSVERFLLIAVPFGRFSSISLKTSIVMLLSIWIIGIGLAVIPALNYYSSTRFYGLNGLCVPLHISDPFFLGWEYSAGIILGVNSVSLVIIAAVYCIMFISIYRTRHATSLPIKDYEFAVRFFFIVLTNASCWFPIIFIKILALMGMEISEDLYAWLVVFVLPVNSAINPMLYTFTTPRYRSKVYRMSIPMDCLQKNRKTCFIKKIRRPSPHSNADTGSTPTASRSAHSASLKLAVHKDKSTKPF